MSPIDQVVSLWDQLTGAGPLDTDAEGRVRLDTWELHDDVQTVVRQRWQQADTGNIAKLADVDWFLAEVHRLYGFAVPGIDYERPVQTAVPWPPLRS